ncbi:MAG: DUF6617 family protein [Methanococcaceae archaeon]
MKTDANKKIDKRFDFSYKQLRESTKEKLISYERNLDLSSLSVDEKIVKLYHVKLLIDQEMKNFNWQDYLTYASERDALRIVFRDNCIFYHDHEEEKMRQSLFLFEKNKLIERLIIENHALLPIFTIESYLRSEYNVVFYLLNQQPMGTTNEDYAKMISSQIRNREECICSLLLRFREQFLAIKNTDVHFLSIADKELKTLRKLLDSDSRPTLALFIDLLKKLQAMDDFILPQNLEKLYHSFLACLNHPDKNSRIRPGDFKQTLKNINEGILPESALFGLALIRYEVWLNDLVYGTVLVNDHCVPNYDLLFDDILKESIQMGVQMIDKFKEQYPSEYLTAEEYEKVIHQRLNKIKIKADQLKVGVYYQYTDEIEMVKCYFINNCMESKEPVFHTEQLRNAFIIDMEIRFFEHELIAIGKGIKAAVEDILKLNSTISMVIAHMVPNRQIVIKTKAAFEKAMQANRHRKPLIYILEDLANDFNQIFEEAEDNLLNLFDQQSYDENLTYALKSLQEIEILKYKSSTRGLDFHQLYVRLETILNVQIDYLTRIPHNSLPALNFEDTPEANDENTRLSFDFKGSESWLTAVLIKVNKRYHYLDPRTPMDHFISVLTSINLMEEAGKIYIGCNTNIFKCIIDNLKPFFKNLTYANIGHSGLFISHLGNPISEDSLKGSKLKKQDIKRDIGSYFV